MSTRPTIVSARHEPGHGSFLSYVTGFLLSLYLSVFSYLIVTRHAWSGNVLLWVIGGLALVQFFVQAFYFLHLGAESRPRWKLLVFGSMIVIVLILVVGSIWIMNNLDYHTMTPAEQKTYLHNNEGL
jgi:cytochrome o ubiquinol oxidase operon protein cyoD